jgi:hypothetical protein
LYEAPNGSMWFVSKSFRGSEAAAGAKELKFENGNALERND